MESRNDDDLDNEGRSDIPVDWPDAAAGPEAQTGEVTGGGAADGDDSGAPDKTDEEVEEESEESFPASDPPSW